MQLAGKSRPSSVDFSCTSSREHPSSIHLHTRVFGGFRLSLHHASNPKIAPNYFRHHRRNSIELRRPSLQIISAAAPMCFRSIDSFEVGGKGDGPQPNSQIWCVCVRTLDIECEAPPTTAAGDPGTTLRGFSKLASTALVSLL